MSTSGPTSVCTAAIRSDPAECYCLRRMLGCRPEEQLHPALSTHLLAPKKHESAERRRGRLLVVRYGSHGVAGPGFCFRANE
jgi:hypothetical protein